MFVGLLELKMKLYLTIAVGTIKESLKLETELNNLLAIELHNDYT